MLPAGSKISEADVLRGFMRNISHAALNCGAAGGGARRAYFEAASRLEKIEGRPLSIAVRLGRRVKP